MARTPVLLRSSTGKLHYAVREGRWTVPACHHTYCNLVEPAGHGEATCGTCRNLRTAQWDRLLKEED